MTVSKTAIFAFTVGMLLTWSTYTTARAESYGSIPDRGIRLGSGFDPVYPDKVFPSCLLAKNECQTGGFGSIACLASEPGVGDKLVSENFVPTTQFSIREIKSKYDYFRELNITASLSGSYGAFSGSGSFSYHSLEDIDAESISWAITARSSYGSFSLPSPKLANEFKGLPDYTLIRSCGTEYVSEVDRGVLASVLYTFHSRSERFEREISAAMSAGFGGAGFGVNADAKMTELIKEASKYGQISIRVFTIGGKGSPALKQLIEQDPSDLPGVRKILASYVESQGVTHSTILGFRTTALGKLLGKPEIDPDYSPYLVFLENYNDYRLKLQEIGKRLYDVIVHQTDYGAGVDFGKISTLTTHVNAELNCINQRARLCRAWTDLVARSLMNGVASDDALAEIQMTHGIANSGASPSTSNYSINSIGLVQSSSTSCVSDSTQITDFTTKLKSAFTSSRSRNFESDWNPCSVAVNVDLFAQTQNIPKYPFKIYYTYSGFKPNFVSTDPRIILIKATDADKVAHVIVTSSADPKIILAAKSNQLGRPEVNLSVDVSALDKKNDIILEVSMNSGSTYRIAIRVPSA